MPTLDVSDTSKAMAILGAYIVSVGLISYLIKNRLFISEATLALGLGVAVGPIALKWFSPLTWVDGGQESLNQLTFQITRIIIGIQVLFAGIDLPKAYLWKEWKSLALLLGPTMIAAWFSSALLIWGLIPGLTFLEALVISSCITPTDPVLANSICKGRFAEKHVPLHVRNIIIAESGANDGLGYPFLYLALYLVFRHTPDHSGSLGHAVWTWFYEIVIYEILLSVVIGAVIGYSFRKLLRLAERKDLVDHDNFLAFGVGLSFFTLGVVGMIGSDDILCCFVAGNAFTWDDWFRVETEEHAVQDVIDLLLNSAVFLYIGAIMPWGEFGNFWDISPWRLVVLGLAIVLLRRPPWVLAMYKFIPTTHNLREGAFTGYFGCIGVSAIFYVQVALEQIPEERERLRNVITPVVYFMVLTSVIIHGITIPIGKGALFTMRSSTKTPGKSNAVSSLQKDPAVLPTEPSREGSSSPSYVGTDGAAEQIPDVQTPSPQEDVVGSKVDPRKARKSKVTLPSSVPS